jgi:hypothetical protein
MLDPSIALLPSREGKRLAVQQAIIKAVTEGSFTYTDLILCGTELMTIGFEVMDGVTVGANNTPQTLAAETYDPPGGTVRLVSIDPNFSMQYSRWVRPVIPGTNKQAPAYKKATHYGADATIEDRLDRGRIPRGILVRHGWPYRQIVSNGSDVGRVVEWKWLERVATSPDASDDYRELYATLKARPDAAKTQQAPITKNAAKAVGATP